ncbi:SLAM family member 6 isoform X2 [Phodopus roborovskii]|uniref:Slamf6 protein n=1 Tax=Phodopus roborovskii TaxID=109678 RepID=A0AAU9ZA82_PHORO|nr:SLAM family member 6 isoform X2 [Phodopus roborovskii]CAH6789494.1 Slamf6 [Phodopus roborovskii]
MVVSRAPAPDSAGQMMVWLFPLVFCLGSGNEVSQSTQSPKVVNGVLGGSATLLLELPAGKETSVIVWHHEAEASQVTAILIVQLNKSETPHIIKTNPKEGERLSITQSYSLQVNNLTMADAGVYKAQITTEDSTHDFSIYTLRVFEQLSNLKVTNHTRLFENGTCEIHLTCIVEDPKHTASVGWRDSGSISLGKPNLTVSWDPKNSSDQSYTCQAENAVSNLSVSVSAQSLCKGVLPKKNLQWHQMFIIVGTLLVMVIVCICMCLWKKKTGSLFLASQHPDSSQNTDSPGSPGNNTVYAQVTHPMQEMETPKSIKNDSMTIYSIVNHSREPISPRMNTLKDI